MSNSDLFVNFGEVTVKIHFLVQFYFLVLINYKLVNKSYIPPYDPPPPGPVQTFVPAQPAEE